MIFRIPRGKRRAMPLRFGFWWRKTSFTWNVKFTESCRYDLKSEDQYDTNKLCGIGYLPGHHIDSARFGWRYWEVNGQIELKAYCYTSGQRVMQNLAFCEIGKEYQLQLNIAKHDYIFNVVDAETGKPVGGSIIPYGHDKKLQYRLGVFFGGNQVAPHDLKIELERL